MKYGSFDGGLAELQTEGYFKIDRKLTCIINSGFKLVFQAVWQPLNPWKPERKAMNENRAGKTLEKPWPWLKYSWKSTIRVLLFTGKLCRAPKFGWNFFKKRRKQT